MENKVERPISKITIVGTGKVATFWTQILLKTQGFQLSVCGSSEKKTIDFAEKFGIETQFQIEGKTIDLLIICVQDSFINDVIPRIPNDSLAIVCSGTHSLKNINNSNIGIVYPLQSINEEVELELDDVFFLTELNAQINSNIENWLANIGAKWTETNENQRIDAHLCAVFLNNFTYFILESGLKEISERNLSKEWFKPLIKKTIKNVLLNKNLQTGPARRGDLNTVNEQSSRLNKSQKELYLFLSKMIANKYGYKL